MIERAADGDAPGGTTGRQRRPRQDPPGAASSAEAWIEDLGTVAGEVARVFRVQADRARLRLRRRALGVLLWLPVLLATAVAALRAGWLFVDGIAGACRSVLSALPWLAELAAGVVVLAVIGVTTLLWIRVADARERRFLEEKYADPQPAANAAAASQAPSSAHA